MGIKQFNPYLKEVIKELPKDVREKIFKIANITTIKDSTIILDANALLVRYGSVYPLEVKLLEELSKFIQRIDPSNKIIVVSDSTQDIDEILYLETRIREFEKRYKHLTLKEIDIETQLISKTKVLNAKEKEHDIRRKARLAHEEKHGEKLFSVTQSVSENFKLCCEALNIQHHKCVIEADALMAGIALRESKDRPTYMVSEDSDMFVYNIGSAHILRRCAIGTITEDGKELLIKSKLKGHTSNFEDVDVDLLWKSISITDQNLKFRIPLLMKCDYFKDISLVGPKTLNKHIFVNWINAKDGLRSNPTRILKLIKWKKSGKEITKELEKMFHKSFIDYYSLEDLESISRSDILIPMPVYCIDMKYADVLEQDIFDDYLVALFRFDEGSAIEMRYYKQSKLSPNSAKEKIKNLNSDSLNIIFGIGMMDINELRDD
jgi:hypothetical protein